MKTLIHQFPIFAVEENVERKVSAISFQPYAAFSGTSKRNALKEIKEAIDKLKQFGTIDC
ncbi:MAG: hypothetical protein ACKVOU_11510 [Cytophagales bacterium]